MPNLITADIAVEVIYTATPGQTVFSYTFPIFQTSDLLVFQNEVAATGFTVSGANTAGGGAVTFAAPRVGGERIRLTRAVPIQRSIDLPATGPYSSEDIDREFDRTFAILQQQEGVIDRSVRVAPGEAGIELPLGPSRVNSVLGFDAFGNLSLVPLTAQLGGYLQAQRIEYIAAAGQTVFTMSYTALAGYIDVHLNGVRLQNADYTHVGAVVTLAVAATLGDVVTLSGFINGSVSTGTFNFQQTGIGAVSRSAETKLREVFSVKDFGAVGDGVADDTAAIQAAIDAWRIANRDAAAFIDYPRDLFFPSGNYKISATLNADPIYNTVGGHIYGAGARITMAGGGPAVGMRINAGAASKIWRELRMSSLTFVNCGLKVQSVNGAGINVYGFAFHGLTFEGDPAAHSLWFEGCFEGTVADCRVSRTVGTSLYSGIFVDNSGFGFQSSVVWTGNTTRGGKNGFRQVGYAGDCFRFGNTHLTAWEEGAYIECSGLNDFGGHYEANCQGGVADSGLRAVGGGVITGLTAAAVSLQKYGARVYTASGAGFYLGPGVDYATTAAHKLYFIDGLNTLPVSVQGSFDASAGMVSAGMIRGPSSEFQQAGTGAVLRTAQDKMREVISVKDFGATGDGTTDDTAALNNFFAALNTAGGGVGVIPPGTYRCNSQVTAAAAAFNRTTINAEGARFKPTHAGSGLLITGGSAGGGGLTVRGLVIDIQGNTTTLKGFDNAGALYTELHHCNIEYDLPNTNFDAFVFRNLTASDDNTGSFWWEMHGCSSRQRTGAVPTIRSVVRTQGQANAGLVFNCSLQNAVNGIYVTTESGYTSNSNGLRVIACAFEGLEVGIFYAMNAAGAPDGLSVSNNRFESITTAAFKFTGTAYGGQQPPFFSGNAFAVASVAQYIDWASATATTSWASYDQSQGAPVLRNGLGKVFNFGPREWCNLDNVQPTAIFKAYTNHGIELHEQSSPYQAGAWRIRSGAGTNLTGNTATNRIYPLFMMPTSSTGVEVRNTPGSKAFTGTATAIVTLPVAETDAAYDVRLTPDAANGGCWISGKTTAQFQINFNAAFTGNVGWELRR